MAGTHRKNIYFLWFELELTMCFPVRGLRSVFAWIGNFMKRAIDRNVGHEIVLEYLRHYYIGFVDKPRLCLDR